MPDLSHLTVPDWAWLIFQLLLIVVVAAIALRFVRGFVHRVFKALLEREAREGTAQDLTVVELKKRMATLDSLGVNLLQFFIVIVAGLMILGRLGVDIAPAIAGLGIVGIAVGFGAQTLVKDYLNGALILIENQYGKGDVVRIADVEGTVEDLTLRRTTLRDFEGNVHTVPNSAVVVASNLTRGWARISEELQLPSADLFEAAREVVDRVGREMADDPIWHRRLLEPPHVDGFGVPERDGRCPPDHGPRRRSAPLDGCRGAATAPRGGVRGAWPAVRSAGALKAWLRVRRLLRRRFRSGAPGSTPPPAAPLPGRRVAVRRGRNRTNLRRGPIRAPVAIPRRPRGLSRGARRMATMIQAGGASRDH